MTYSPGHHFATLANGTVSSKNDENLFMIHLHYFDRLMCLKREKHKYENSKKSGKVQEREFGMHRQTSRPFEIVQNDMYVCGFALLTLQPNGDAALPDGNCIFKIPERLKLLL